MAHWEINFKQITCKMQGFIILSLKPSNLNIIYLFYEAPSFRSSLFFYLLLHIIIGLSVILICMEFFSLLLQESIQLDAYNIFDFNMQWMCLYAD